MIPGEDTWILPNRQRCLAKWVFSIHPEPSAHLHPADLCSHMALAHLAWRWEQCGKELALSCCQLLEKSQLQPVPQQPVPVQTPLTHPTSPAQKDTTTEAKPHLQQQPRSGGWPRRPTYICGAGKPPKQQHGLQAHMRLVTAVGHPTTHHLPPLPAWICRANPPENHFSWMHDCWWGWDLHITLHWYRKCPRVSL